VHYDVVDQPGWRGAIERFMVRQFIQRFLIILSVVNAIMLGVIDVNLFVAVIIDSINSAQEDVEHE
jgi:hypothetical protein